MKLSRIVAALAACIPGLCVADPVTVIAIGSQLAASGALGAALTISASTAAWIGVGAAVYGMAKARQDQRKLAAQARAQQVASLADRSYRALTNLPPIETVYGLVTKAGYIVDSFATDLTATSAEGVTRTYPDGLRHLVVVWAAHECQRIDGLIFGQETIGAADVDAQGWALPGTAFSRAQTASRTSYLPAGTSTLPAVAASILSVVDQGGGGIAPTYTLAPDGVTITLSVASVVTWTASISIPMLRMSHHHGGDSQAVDAYLHSVAPTRYTTYHRLAGLCYSVLTFDLRFERWQSGPPSPVAEIRGKKVYDPRTGTTYHTPNAALCVYDYLRHEHGMAVEQEDVLLSSVIAAANACDEYITLGVGGDAISTPRYMCNGTWETGAARESVLDDLCRSMAGSATYSGQWVISAGAYTPHVMTLTDNDLSGSISIVQAGAPAEQLSNGVRGVYVPRWTLTAVDMEPYSNAALVAADGGELWESIDLPFTDRSWACRQIARITIETRRNGMVISYPAKIHAIRLQPGDRVAVTSAEYGWTSKTFRVTDTQLAPRQSVVLTLQEDAPEAWDAVDTNKPDPTPNTGLPSPWGVVAPITGLTAVSGSSVLQVAGDGTIITRVRVSWDPVSWPYATGVELTWTPPGGTATAVSVPGDQTTVDIIGPIDGQTITIAARVRTLAEPSDWSYLAHLVLGELEPPPVIPSLTVIQGSGGMRRIQWTYPDEPVDFKQFEARYWSGATLPAWDAMNTIFTAHTGERARESRLPPDGTHYISMLAVDRSGNISARTTIQVTLSGDPGTLVNSTSPHATGWPGDRVGCYVSGSYLVPGSPTAGTWASAGTWAGAGTWGSTVMPVTSMSYAQTVDMTTVAPRYIRVEHDSTGMTAVELCTSPNGTDWTAWAPITTSSVSARYYQVRITLSGTTGELRTMTINIYL